jgi:hypothetical protein
MRSNSLPGTLDIICFRDEQDQDTWAQVVSSGTTTVTIRQLGTLAGTLVEVDLATCLVERQRGHAIDYLAAETRTQLGLTSTTGPIEPVLPLSVFETVHYDTEHPTDANAKALVHVWAIVHIERTQFVDVVGM